MARLSAHKTELERITIHTEAGTLHFTAAEARTFIEYHRRSEDKAMRKIALDLEDMLEEHRSIEPSYCIDCGKRQEPGVRQCEDCRLKNEAGEAKFNAEYEAS